MRDARERLSRILYVSDMARELGCSQKAIRARVARGLLPYRRLGGRVVFIRSEFEEFVLQLPGVSVQEAKDNVALRNGELVRHE